MRFLITLAVASFLAGCVTHEHAQTSRQSVRASKVQQQAQKQQLQASRPVILGLAY